MTRYRLTLAIPALLLAVFLLYPLGWILAGPSMDGGRLDLSFLVDLFSSRRNLRALQNSMIAAFGATALSVAIGVPLALLFVRTEMPLRRTWRALVTASFVTPSFLLGFAYITLLGPNNGLINRALRAVFGFASGPLDIYGIGGLVFLATLESVPLVMIATMSALATMDGNLEHAARMLGARPGRVLMRVTLPIIRPAIGAGALLAFISTLSLYGAPAILGVRVIPTEIRAALGSTDDAGVLAGLSCWLMAISLLAFFAYQYLMKRQASFVTVTGNWVGAEPLALGRWRWAASLLCGMYAAIALLVPYAVLAYASVSHAFGVVPSLANLTLSHYTFLASDALSRNAIWNSALLATGAAMLATALALAIALLDVRHGQRRAVKSLQYLAMLPFGLPSIVLGAGLVLAFTRPPLVLYGTLWILLAAYVVKFMPLAVRACSAGLRQIDPALDEAAAILGASQRTRLLRITVPLVRGSLYASGFLVFVPSFRELGASVLLSGAGTETIAVAMMQSWGSVSFETVCAMGVVALVVSYLVSRMVAMQHVSPALASPAAASPRSPPPVAASSIPASPTLSGERP